MNKKGVPGPSEKVVFDGNVEYRWLTNREGRFSKVVHLTIWLDPDKLGTLAGKAHAKGSITLGDGAFTLRGFQVETREIEE